MAKRLIASDYDGTFRCNGKTTDYDKEMIRKWREKGNYFGIVTGRGLTFFNDIKRDGIDDILDYVIVFNGAYVSDLNGKVIFESFIPRNVFAELEKLFSTFENIVDYDRVTEADSFHQYYAQFENFEQALEAAALANEKFGEEITAFVNGPHVNIAKKGSSKAEGVRIILEHYGLKPEEGATVGDDFNDLEMITQHHGWAMQSGQPAVIAQAEHTCRSVGALAEFLMK